MIPWGNCVKVSTNQLLIVVMLNKLLNMYIYVFLYFLYYLEQKFELYGHIVRMNSALKELKEIDQFAWNNTVKVFRTMVAILGVITSH